MKYGNTEEGDALAELILKGGSYGRGLKALAAVCAILYEELHDSKKQELLLSKVRAIMDSSNKEYEPDA